MVELEQRVARLEAFTEELHALGLVALRIAVGLLGRQVRDGQLTSEEAKRWIEIAAEQVGEGSPHLELAARKIARAVCSKVPQDPSV